MAAYANAGFGYLPKLGDAAGARSWPVAAVADSANRSAGAIVTLPLLGKLSRTRTRAALVYLPPQYFAGPGRHFPVLYLTQGWPGVPLDWFRGGQAAAAGLATATAGHPTTLDVQQLADSARGEGPALLAKSFFVVDVVPTVDRRLRILPAAAALGVAGNSAAESFARSQWDFAIQGCSPR